MRSPSYRSGNDVIVHLRWNTPHKRGGKQSGDVNWSIITKARSSSTQEAWLRLRSIRNVMSYLTILILETVLNVTPRHCPRSLINYGEPLRRGSIRWGEQVQITMATEAAMQVHDTLPQGIESVHALL